MHGSNGTNFPGMLRVARRVEGDAIRDLPAHVWGQLDSLHLEHCVRAGQTAAITCSSRGIANYAAILGALVSFLETLGLEPFLVPAMGSHGGATAEGQAAVLANRGISEAAVGAPVRSSLDVAQLGMTVDGVPVFVDKLSLSADHIIVANRVQEHTEFENEAFESGLQKMLAIGLGKEAGAFTYHRAMLSLGYARVIASVAEVVLTKAPILFGLGIVEDEGGRTVKIRAARAPELVGIEAELFALAKARAARLPFDEADVTH